MLNYVLVSIKDAWCILTPQKKRLMPIAFILILISTIFDIFGIVSLVPVIVGGLVKSSEDIGFLPNFILEMSHNQLLFLVVVILLCRLITQGLITYFLASFSFGLGAELKSNLTTKYINSKGGGLNLTATDLMASGQKLIEDFTQGYVLSFLTALNNVMILILALGSILFVAPASILGLIVAIGVIVGCYLIISSRFISHFGKLSTKATLEQASTLDDLSKGYKTIVGSGLDMFFLNRYKASTDKYANALTKSLVARGIPRYLFELIFALLIIIFFAIFSSETGSKAVQVGILVLAARILPVITTLSNSLLNFVHAIPVISELTRLFNAVKYDHSKKRVSRLSYVGNNLILRVKDVSPSRNENILIRPINFELKAGYWVALKGPSGIGKSSFLDLVAGVNDQGHGQIELEYPSDIDLQRANKIAYVSQDAFIMNGNVQENLSAGTEEFNDTKMLSTLGFDIKNTNFLKQHGRTLSGGEKQRIAICRAIYSGARILIMDEPISAINKEIAKQVIEFMKQHDDLSVIMAIHGNDYDIYFDEIINVGHNIS